jgi:hypothetical protein
LAYLALSRPDRAAAAFRAVTGTSTPGHERNHIYYGVRLAQAAHQQRDPHRAAEIAHAALPAVAAMQSRRTTQLLAHLRADLGRQRERGPQVRAFFAAYDDATAG